MFQIIIIALSSLGVGILAYFVIKATVTPKRIDSINKLVKQGKTSAAIKLAKSIISKNQRDYKAHYYLGKAYLADNKPELALMEFKIVNQNALFDSDMPEIEFRKQISQLYLRFNQPEEALKEYDPNERFNREEIYSEYEGQIEEAEQQEEAEQDEDYQM